MLNKKEREKVLALYFNAVKNYTVILLKGFAGEKTSEYWDGGENELQILLYNLKLEKEAVSIQNYFYKLELEGRQFVTRGNPVQFQQFINKLYQLKYVTCKGDIKGALL